MEKNDLEIIKEILEGNAKVINKIYESLMKLRSELKEHYRDTPCPKAGDMS